MPERQNISSGAKWESIVGYSRAVKVGDLIWISGTAPVDENSNIVGIGNAYEQAKFCLKKIENVLTQAGSKLSDVVRTRIYVVDISLWEEIGKAHGEVFGDIRPATTMVEVKGLVDENMLVEIEADAVISNT